MYESVRKPSFETGRFDTIDHSFLLLVIHFCQVTVTVDRKRKTPHIYIPEEWIDLTASARCRDPFEVTRMTAANIYSLESISQQLCNRKKTVYGEKVEFHKITWFRFEQSNSQTYKYRCTLSDLEVWKTVHLSKCRCGRPSTLHGTQLRLGYASSRGINPRKKEDVLKLLDYIPPRHHAYYKNLQVLGREEPDVVLEEY